MVRWFYYELTMFLLFFFHVFAVFVGRMETSSQNLKLGVLLKHVKETQARPFCKALASGRWSKNAPETDQNLQPFSRWIVDPSPKVEELKAKLMRMDPCSMPPAPQPHFVLVGF